MKDRLHLNGPAVKTVQVPDDYPAKMFSRGFAVSNQSVVYAACEAAALEVEYERLTKSIKAGGKDVLANAMSLVELEDRLFDRYRTMADALDPDHSFEKAKEMVEQTSLLAKLKSRGEGRQL